jgi:hypothetical protein
MSFNFFDLFWIFLIVSSLQPWIQRRKLEFQRIRTLQDFEQKRRSRVILGVAESRYESVGNRYLLKL